MLDRNSWRAALENGNYELLNPESKENGLTNEEEELMEIDENHVRVKDRFTSISVICVFLFVCSNRVWCSYKLTEFAVVSAIVQIDGVFLMFRLQELKAEGQSATSTPQPVNNIVHYLAQALAQIEQGIERKFLKAPLGKICYFCGFFWNFEGIKPPFHYLRQAKDRKSFISNVELCGSCVELQSYAYTEISDPIWASDALKYLNFCG